MIAGIHPVDHAAERQRPSPGQPERQRRGVVEAEGHLDLGRAHAEVGTVGGVMVEELVEVGDDLLHGAPPGEGTPGPAVGFVAGEGLLGQFPHALAVDAGPPLVWLRGPLRAVDGLADEALEHRVHQ